MVTQPATGTTDAGASVGAGGNDRLRFGIQTTTIKPWAQLADEWRWLDGLGVETIWMPDHLVPPFRPEGPIFDPWTAMAGLASLTERARMGVLVSCNTFRHPPLLAKMAVTIDHISNGRLEFGLGAGWFVPEHTMYGIPFPEAPELVQRFREAVEICDALFRHETVSYDGRYYRLEEALFRPAPVQQPRPPFTLGAHGPKMMRIVARHADRWNSTGTVEEMRRRNGALDEACAEVGRDPREILRSHLHVAMILPDEKPWESPDAFADFVGRYREAGVQEFLLQPPKDLPRDTLERTWRETIPAL